MRITEEMLGQSASSNLFLLDLSKDSDKGLKERKMVSRILAMGNIIATVTMRGPGQFVEIPDLKLLGNNVDKNGYMAGMKVFENKALKSIVIVGRMNEGIEDDTVEFTYIK